MSKNILDKLNEGRQYRNIDLRSFETRAAGDDEMIVTGYATTFNEPYELWRYADRGNIYIVREQIDPGAFDDCDMSDVVMQYDHVGRVFARLSNDTLGLTVDNRGLLIRANLGGTDIGRQLFQEIEGGYTTKMSIGFTVAEDKREQTITRDEENGTTETVVLRTILKFSKLYDVSAVSLPANDATSISARSFGEGVIAEVMEEIQKREAVKAKIRILTEV